MANKVYTVGFGKLVSGQFSWGSANWYVQLVDSGYVPDFDTDLVPGALAGHTIGSPVAMSGFGITTAPGEYDIVAGATVFSGISAALTVDAGVIYFDDGAGNIFLFAYFDSGTGFPYTTTGANFQIQWDNLTVGGTVAVVTQ